MTDNLLEMAYLNSLIIVDELVEKTQRCGIIWDQLPNLAFHTTFMWKGKWHDFYLTPMQKKVFGDAFKKINYIECATPDGKAQTDICKTAGIKSYPTWEFKPGDRVEGVLTLDQLKQHSNYSNNIGPPTASTS